MFFQGNIELSRRNYAAVFNIMRTKEILPLMQSGNDTLLLVGRNEDVGKLVIPVEITQNVQLLSTSVPYTVSSFLVNGAASALLHLPRLELHIGRCQCASAGILCKFKTM